MDALSALTLIQDRYRLGDQQPCARPLSWRGTGRAIAWEASDDASPIPWELGWRVIGDPVSCNLTEKEYKLRAQAKLPGPDDLFGDWEIVDRAAVVAEWPGGMPPGPIG